MGSEASLGVWEIAGAGFVEGVLTAGFVLSKRGKAVVFGMEWEGVKFALLRLGIGVVERIWWEMGSLAGEAVASASS